MPVSSISEGTSMEVIQKGVRKRMDRHGFGFGSNLDLRNETGFGVLHWFPFLCQDGSRK